MTEIKPKKGDLRVWYINSIEKRDVSVKTTKEAISLITKWYEDDLKNDNVVWNSMGLEIYDGNGLDGLMWQEWCDLEGFDINDIVEARNGQNG